MQLIDTPNPIEPEEVGVRFIDNMVLTTLISETACKFKNGKVKIAKETGDGIKSVIWLSLARKVAGVKKSDIMKWEPALIGTLENGIMSYHLQKNDATKYIKQVIKHNHALANFRQEKQRIYKLRIKVCMSDVKIN